jgi:hypothetical protein
MFGGLPGLLGRSAHAETAAGAHHERIEVACRRVAVCPPPSRDPELIGSLKTRGSYPKCGVPEGPPLGGLNPVALPAPPGGHEHVV